MKKCYIEWFALYGYSMNPSLYTLYNVQYRAGRAWKRTISRKRRQVQEQFGHILYMNYILWFSRRILSGKSISREKKRAKKA